MRNKEIKYHFGSTLDLVEGFEPGDIYFQVHFHIHTPSYRNHGCVGFNTTSASNEFYARCVTFLSQLGFSFSPGDTPHYALIGDHGKLHIHPDDISGCLHQRDIELIHLAFTTDDHLIGHRYTEAYRLLEIIDEKELQKRVSLSKPSIMAIIYKKLRTSRQSTFYDERSIKFHSMVDSLPGFQFHTNPHSELLIKLVKTIVNQMVCEGYLVKTEISGANYYRSANATQMKKRRLTIPSKSEVTLKPHLVAC